MKYLAIVKKFEELFGEPEVVSRAPGKINIIGEHTDYNGGFALPVAIDKDITFVLRKNNSNIVRAYAMDINEHGEFDLDTYSPMLLSGWQLYIFGAIKELSKRSVSLKGFDVIFSGDIPIGAGLSSSSALTCALTKGLDKLFDGNISDKEIALIAQEVEHRYVGTKCGIMGQFTVMFGKEDSVLKIDCLRKTYNYLPLELNGFAFVVCDSGVKHFLPETAYNKRREECRAGVRIIQDHYSDVNCLGEVTLEMLVQCAESMDDTTFRRCSYVVEENARLETAVRALEEGDLSPLGALMYASHSGLSKKFDVSCEELDFLVETTRPMEFVLGARMIGAGFGGCTLNLVRESDVDQFMAEQKAAYKAKFDKDLDIFVVGTGKGASVEDVFATA